MGDTHKSMINLRYESTDTKQTLVPFFKAKPHQKISSLMELF